MTEPPAPPLENAYSTTGPAIDPDAVRRAFDLTDRIVERDVELRASG